MIEYEGVVFCDTKKLDAALAQRDALVKALDWAMARVIRMAPHHAAEGDAELYAFAEAHSLLAKYKNPIQPK